MRDDQAVTALSGALRPTPIIDSDHPAVIAFATGAVTGVSGDVARAVALHYAVRDGFRYDPYKLDLSIKGLSASQVIALGSGWCVPKAILLAAAARAVGIPARVGFADVRNHLSTARLRETMGTDVFYYHGYTALYLNEGWVKATPAFNIELCRKFGLLPLDFDGSADSIYHAFDASGQRHMEYVGFRGEFDEVPRDDILRIFDLHYPHIARLDHASWDEDVAAEAS
jgi:transglutaminase-like putative cysteine protease